MKNIENLHSEYLLCVNNCWVPATEGMGFLEKFIKDNHVSNEDSAAIVATYNAELQGQDGDKGACNALLHAKDALLTAAYENATNGLKIIEPTREELATEHEALTGAEIISDANDDFKHCGSLTDKTIASILSYGQEASATDDFVQ